MDTRIARRNGQLAIVVHQLLVQCVGFHAAIVSQLQADQPVDQQLGDVVIADGQAVDRGQEDIAASCADLGN